nr:hypothetical protein [Tanacetum cinerariifolium]
MKKLDRILVNGSFMNSLKEAFGHFIPFLTSDHSAAVLTILKSLTKKRRSFRFSNYIVDKDELLPTVKKDRLKTAQKDMVQNPHNESIKAKEVECLANYLAAINDEEKFFFQKAKVEWIRPNGKGSEINAHNLFSTKLSEEEALKMVANVNDKEIKEALFDIGENKAPDPDGYSSAFFKHSWSIIGKDICQAIKEFLNTSKLLEVLNANLITLIPKIPQPHKVSDYRPIAGGVVYYIRAVSMYKIRGAGQGQ